MSLVWRTVSGLTVAAIVLLAAGMVVAGQGGGSDAPSETGTTEPEGGGEGHDIEETPPDPRPMTTARQGEGPPSWYTPGVVLLFERDEGRGGASNDKIEYKVLVDEGDTLRFAVGADASDMDRVNIHEIDKDTGTVRKAPEASLEGTRTHLWIPPVEEGAKIRILGVEHTIHRSGDEMVATALMGTDGIEAISEYRYAAADGSLRTQVLTIDGETEAYTLSGVAVEPVAQATAADSARNLVWFGILFVLIGAVSSWYAYVKVYKPLKAAQSEDGQLDVANDAHGDTRVRAPGPKSGPMFCTGCGETLAGDVRFCASCGEPVAG